jgi:succinate-acetate transporter protein
MHVQGKRTFLARPFWRDYVLGYVLIATGFLLTAPAAPAPFWLGGVLLGWGVATMALAIGWSLWATARGLWAGSKV